MSDLFGRLHVPLRRFLMLISSLFASTLKRWLDTAKTTFLESLASLRRSWPALTRAFSLKSHALAPMQHRKGVWKAIIAEAKLFAATARANLQSVGFAPMLSIDRLAGRA